MEMAIITSINTEFRITFTNTSERLYITRVLHTINIYFEYCVGYCFSYFKDYYLNLTVEYYVPKKLYNNSV